MLCRVHTKIKGETKSITCLSLEHAIGVVKCRFTVYGAKSTIERIAKDQYFVRSYTHPAATVHETRTGRNFSAAQHQAKLMGNEDNIQKTVIESIKTGKQWTQYWNSYKAVG